MSTRDASPPADPALRQPVHLMVGGAHLFRRDVAAKLGRIAEGYLERHAPGAEGWPEAFGTPLPAGMAPLLRARLAAKLAREPVESFLIDFEDGFGARSGAEEDAAAGEAAEETAAGVAAGSLPPAVGIRIKPLSAVSRERALRTLELFLAGLARAGCPPPEGFAALLPKIDGPEQVELLARTLDVLERRLGFAEGCVAIDLMIETPQSVIGPGGRIAAPGLVEAAGGRCRTVHLGAYDLTAARSISAGDQTLDHPLLDAARQLLSLSLAGTGVQLCDGATNVLPVEPHRGPDLSRAEREQNRAAVREAWRRHCADVRRSLQQGYGQSWDLHPAQLVSRYAAVFSYFLEELDAAAHRLRRFVAGAGRAVLTGSVFDDEASGQGLLNFFRRGLASGALTPEEVARSGLTPDEIATRSFRAILDGRTTKGGSADETGSRTES